MIKLADIKLNGSNPRQINEAKLEKLKHSIKEFEKMLSLRPIVVDGDNVVLGGNMRLRALRELGYKEIPDEWIKKADDLTEAEKREFVIKDNVGFGEWDWDVLANEWDAEELSDWGLDVPEVWNAEEVTEDEFDEEPPTEPQTVLGDLYELNGHRVHCADSTDADAVGKLMGDKKASICFTSPPYNLGVSAKLSGNTKIGKKGNAYEEYDDNQSEESWYDLMDGFTKNAIAFSQYAIINVQSLAGNRKSLWKWINNFSHCFCDVAIWDKSHAAPQQAQRVMNSVFEFIFFLSNENPNRAIRTAVEFRGNVNNIFRMPPQRKNDFASIHGATFPIELPFEILQIFSMPKTIVSDLFLGSGTTLIAAEQLNRTCYGQELDPAYCDVIIRRWVKYMKENNKPFAVKRNGKDITNEEWLTDAPA